MTHPGHEVVKCVACEAVISQCRCMDKNKPVVRKLCEECSTKPAPEKFPRNICTVIARMLVVIPSEQDRLRQALERVSKDARYRPPEIAWVSWEEASRALAAHLPDHAEPGWQTELRAIWTGSNGLEVR